MDDHYPSDKRSEQPDFPASGIGAEITVFEKAGGPLTKRIGLRDGKIINDASACRMASGSAWRVKIDSMAALAELINGFKSNQAYALGRLKDGLPDQVRVVRADKLNGAGDDPDVIARTKNHLVFAEGKPGLALLDFDAKGMSDAAKRRMAECGGDFWGAICSVLPALKTVGRVERASTSSGLRNKETGETYPGSGGLHIDIAVRDAADIKRFLSDLHDHCWLAGFGCGTVGAAGQFLEHSIIDKSVGSSERLIFEGPPIIELPLVQEGRDAVAHDGDALDTRLCPPLTDSEKRELRKLKAAERTRLQPDMQMARAIWSANFVRDLVARGMSEDGARAQVDRWIDCKELSGAFPLPFDDPQLAGRTVEQVLAEPDKYVGKTLSDPFEGPDYGRGKAIVYRRRNGSLFIHSFAHGGMIYELKASTGVVVPVGFELNERGLFYQPQATNRDPDPAPVKVCGPFTIEARTSDDAHHAHGLLMRWNDADRERHTWAMPLRMVHEDGNGIASEMQDAGLRCYTSRIAHECLKTFLGAVTVERRVQCVDHAGWHGDCYVLPNGRVFGADPESLVFQSERAVTSGRYIERGPLDEWCANIAQYAVGNNFLVFSLSVAFTPPLLDILGEESGGSHWYGTSRTGKTTLVRCAISVYGPAVDPIRSWRATANGLEAVAAETNDGLLILDEISQVNAHEVGAVIYMLGNSAGKQRANRVGGARPLQICRTQFLSTGEITAAAKMAEVGRRTRAGQDVRMIEISADAGAGMGVWQNLHGLPSGAALTDHLKAASRTYCGTAGAAYLDQLARDRADDPEILTATLREAIKKFLEAANIAPGADGQIVSVAKRFALIAAAGELATTYGITGWDEGVAMRAADFCFKRWLDARGGNDPGEDLRALDQVRAFIAAHGSSRFERDDSDNDQRVFNRAGFRLRLGKAGTECEYLILPPVWRNEVCAGLDAKQAAKALDRYGFLIRSSDSNRLTVTRRCGKDGCPRGYCIRGSILEEDAEPEAASEEDDR